MNRPCLETARLWLRPYRPDDLDALHRLWTDPAVRRYLFDDEVVARAFVADEIAGSIASFRARGFGQWAVRRKDEAALIGFCGYRCFHTPPEVQLIYGLAPACWGQGLAAEAARAAIRYGFDRLGFDRVVVSADAPNTASFRVMEKAGMTFEKQVAIDGRDTVYYAISRAAFRPDASFYRLHHGDA